MQFKFDRRTLLKTGAALAAEDVAAGDAALCDRVFEGSADVLLPDEFLVSGEALVRNLRRGMDQSRELGCDPKDGCFLPMPSPRAVTALSGMPTLSRKFIFQG